MLDYFKSWFTSDNTNDVQVDDIKEASMNVSIEIGALVTCADHHPLKSVLADSQGEVISVCTSDGATLVNVMFPDRECGSMYVANYINNSL